MAGESAEQLARQKRERAERLLRSAEMYERGAAGERTTGAILDQLRAYGWTVLHDVRWPGRPRANIDHVVIGPSGVFVIDSKNWSGRIDFVDDTFRCNGRRQDRVVAAAGEAAIAIVGLLSLPAALSVHSVICLVREERVAGRCHEVMVCSTATLEELLISRGVVLNTDQMAVAARELQILLHPATHRPRSQPWSPATAVPPRPPRQRQKRKRPVALALLGGLLGLLPIAAAGAVAVALMSQASVTTYDSCAGLRADHPHGVGTAWAVAELTRHHRVPETDDAVYRANSGLDRDHDGLVCERHVGGGSAGVAEGHGRGARVG